MERGARPGRGLLEDERTAIFSVRFAAENDRALLYRVSVVFSSKLNDSFFFWFFANRKFGLDFWRKSGILKQRNRLRRKINQRKGLSVAKQKTFFEEHPDSF